MKAALSLLPFFFALSAVSATPAPNQRRDGWNPITLPGTDYIPNIFRFHHDPDHSGTFHPTGTYHPHPHPTGAYHHPNPNSGIHFEHMNSTTSSTDVVNQAETNCGGIYPTCQAFAVWTGLFHKRETAGQGVSQRDDSQRVWNIVYVNFTLTAQNFREAPADWSIEDAAAYSK